MKNSAMQTVLKGSVIGKDPFNIFFGLELAAFNLTLKYSVENVICLKTLFSLCVYLGTKMNF